MYFDEDMLLDLRFHYLNQFVKKFVITEATYTHNGTKKKLNFDINKFKKFKDKITYIVVENQPR
jgi:Glycosyltransferase family 17.